jgi:hypothetical protein
VFWAREGAKRRRKGASSENVLKTRLKKWGLALKNIVFTVARFKISSAESTCFAERELNPSFWRAQKILFSSMIFQSFRVPPCPREEKINPTFSPYVSRRNCVFHKFPGGEKS